MRVTYDATTRAAYVCLSDTMVLTTREITNAVLVDLDADANVVGVELLNVDAPTIEGRCPGRRKPRRRRGVTGSVSPCSGVAGFRREWRIC
jgi:uncharacterized protein YuzE